MRAVTVSYHDAVESAPEASGFPGTGAAIYKLEVGEMRRHFEAIDSACDPGPTVIGEHEESGGTPLFLAFDDGGRSAATLIAPMLEEFGWRGHFFITAGKIGEPAFVDADQIREMRARGHVIGSHSWSHPTRMSECSRSELGEEWRRSVTRLEEILGEPVDVASVPGGYFSEAVAKEAAAAGIRYLFTSEPTKRAYEVDGCLVLGRYTLLRGMPAGMSAGFASIRGSRIQLKQAIHWKLKKVAKKVGGKHYLAARDRILKRRGGAG